MSVLKKHRYFIVVPSKLYKFLKKEGYDMTNFVESKPLDKNTKWLLTKETKS